MTAMPAKPRHVVQQLPIGERDVITIAEASALGYGSLRVLYGMIASKRLTRCVIRIGNGRNVRLLRAVLAEELQEASR